MHISTSYDDLAQKLVPSPVENVGNVSFTRTYLVPCASLKSVRGTLSRNFEMLGAFGTWYGNETFDS